MTAQVAKMTITEALAEVRTIGKRLEKKKQAVLANVARDGRMLDPLGKDGGSEKFVAQERQAIRDLEDRLIRIRTQIQLVNLNTPLTVGKRRMSVAEWLTYRREVAEQQQAFYSGIGNAIRAIRTKYEQPSFTARNVAQVNQTEAKPIEVALHLDEKTLISEQEELETLLGTLDGQLSLLNATTTIEI
jgi:hypothetical protein